MAVEQRSDLATYRTASRLQATPQEHRKDQRHRHRDPQLWRTVMKTLPHNSVEHNYSNREAMHSQLKTKQLRSTRGGNQVWKFWEIITPGPCLYKKSFCVLLVIHLLAHRCVTVAGNQTSQSSATSTIMQGLSLAFGVSQSATTDQASLDGYQNGRPLSVASINDDGLAKVRPTLSSGQNIFKILNRSSLLKAGSSNRTMNNERPPPDSFKFPGRASYQQQCQSCQMLEKVKQDNLESIKMHILMRLQMSQLPNITAPISVPQNILEKFYRSYNMSRGQKPPARQGHRTSKKPIDVENRESPRRPKKRAPPDTKARPKQRADEEDSGTDYFNDGAADDENGEHFADSYDDRYGEVDDSYHDGYDEYFEHFEEDYYDEDELFSRTNSYYVFPTTSRVRHYRKTEVLNFTFDNSHSKILRCILHVFVRGHSWIRENDGTLLEGNGRGGPHAHSRHQEIVLSVHRAIRRPNAMNFTHTIKLTETLMRIPSGSGQWKQIEVKDMASHWTENRNATQYILIKVAESWMRPLIVISGGAQQNPLTAHVELVTQDSRRLKRSTSLDCQENDQEVRCCRYPLKVNFTNFGWHFVVAPTSFDAYFCNGECKVGYLEQYAHTHITSLTTSATPCCSPTKMSPLSLLYFNLDQILVLSTIPNMSVEKCSCS